MENEPSKRIGIGFLGAGTVGGGALDVLLNKREQLTAAVGAELVVRKILVRDVNKARAVALPPELLTTCVGDILDNPEIQVIVELIGGEEPARTYMARALAAGKHVVTANKEVIAKHGPSLMRLAAENDANLFFEAAVGGGIPVISTLRQDLVANKMHSIQAIINGTTNYILTDMATGRDYAEALADAQRLGYAEADPRNDVEGIDAVYKLSILATLAFHTSVRPTDIFHSGITRLTARDFRYATEMGYVIKLIAWARLVEGPDGDQVEGAVYPMLLSKDHHLALVRGVYNAILLDGDQIDKLMLYGRGAGAKPTASAVVADLCRVAHNVLRGVTDRLSIIDQDHSIRDFGEQSSRFYFRMTVADQPGVLGQIARILGDHKISIASFIQKEAFVQPTPADAGDVDSPSRSAEIVIMTHTATEKLVEDAMIEIRRLAAVREIASFVRVER